MQLENSAPHNDLASKLANLEEQVTQLTSELAIDRATISQLKQLVSEKQSEIAQLEAALNAARRTLNDKLLLQIRDYQQHIQTQFITPALQKIQAQINCIQGYIAEIKQFINRQIIAITMTIHKTSAVVSKLPAHTQAFFAKTYAEIVTAKINHLITATNQSIEKIKRLIEHDVVASIQTTLDKMITTSKKRTAVLRVNAEQKLIKGLSESVSELFDDLMFSGKELVNDSINRLHAAMQKLLTRLQQLIQNSKLYQSIDASLKSIRHPPATTFA